MKISLPFLALLLAVIVLGAYVLLGSNTSGPYDSFAQCLTHKSVKMYGAFWCPHCKAQKEDFGTSFKYIHYVECSLPDGSGQNGICNDAGIHGYPTWEFADGKRIEGEMTFADLARFSGCTAPGT